MLSEIDSNLHVEISLFKCIFKDVNTLKQMMYD